MEPMISAVVKGMARTVGLTLRSCQCCAIAVLLLTLEAAAGTEQPGEVKNARGREKMFPNESYDQGEAVSPANRQDVE